MEKRENETLTVRDIKQILNISINAAYKSCLLRWNDVPCYQPPISL